MATARPGGSKSLYLCTLTGSRGDFRRRYNILRLMLGQTSFFGRPALTPKRSEGGRRWPSTRRLVYRLLPSRPQERFRTLPMLESIRCLQAFVTDMLGQVRTEQVPLHDHATFAFVDSLR